MEIAGYQSDIKQQITNTTIEDTFTAEKSIAEFGITTGNSPNVYELALTPKLSKGYQKGLRLQVQFHKSNTGAVMLNVDGLGEVPVVKIKPKCSEDTGGDIPIGDSGPLSKTAKLSVKKPELKQAASKGFELQPLEEDDISVKIHYILLYDGQQFQIVNPFEDCTSKMGNIITPPPSNELFFNRQEIFTIGEDQIDPRIELNPGRNRYAAINGNLIVARDIRFKRTGGPGKLFGARIKFPKPLDPLTANTPGFVQSLEGDTFFYRMSRDGVIQVQGELVGVNDEINLNFYPYIAKFPFEFDDKIDFSGIEVAKTDNTAAKTTTKKTATKKSNTTAKKK